MKRSIMTSLGTVAVVSLALAGCSSSSGGGTTGGSSGEPTSSEPVTITLAAWGLAKAPEFQTLADTFHAANPNITVKLKEYDATNYDTQMTADLVAGAGPDLYVLKNLKNFVTYQDGGQLLDVSDVVSKLPKGVTGLDSYKVDGSSYAVPYRQDSWYLYYNKDLFKAAGVPLPDGTWTWDDYATNAAKITAGLKAAGSGAKGTYQHVWPSVVQSFALAQTPKADPLSGDFSYLKPYYERALKLQDSGATLSYGTATTNSLTYTSQFGTQKAAMTLMGSWYVATLINEQKVGQEKAFGWGIVPVPQRDVSTIKKPVTFGLPTGVGINPAIDKSKLSAAKAFLSFVAGEQAATALAGIGITPAFASDAVTAAYFGVAGMPADELSKTTFTTHDTKPEYPVSKYTVGLQDILADAHSSIMSGSTGVDAAILEAEARAKNEVLKK